jgi:hypothetical protein
VRQPLATPAEIAWACDVLATSSDPGDQMIARRLRNEAWAAKGSEIVDGDNFRAADDGAARIAQTWCQMKDEEEAARSASRALGWWLVALLIVASVAVGMVVGHFVIKVLANAAVTVVQAEAMGGW